MVTIFKLQDTWCFYVFYLKKTLVSKVSMVTCFLGGVGYTWSPISKSRIIGVFMLLFVRPLLSKVSMVTFFLGGVDFIWLRFGFKLQNNWRFGVFINETPG